ncbi:hypothetical protein BC830DRAFT_331558 [Chytriomyces sp. MP71]|nr:hypothetical protein BC830DRAFT_331558 [Chytriomyces sp. MP71]
MTASPPDHGGPTAVELFVQPRKLHVDDIASLHSPSDWMDAFPSHTSAAAPAAEAPAQPKAVPTLTAFHTFPRRKAQFRYQVGATECDSMASAVEALMKGDAGVTSPVVISRPNVRGGSLLEEDEADEDGEYGGSGSASVLSSSCPSLSRSIRGGTGVVSPSRVNSADQGLGLLSPTSSDNLRRCSVAGYEAESAIPLHIIPFSSGSTNKALCILTLCQSHQWRQHQRTP